MEKSVFRVCQEITRFLCQDFSSTGWPKDCATVLLGMPVRVTGLMVRGSFETMEASTVLFTSLLYYQDSCVMVLLLGSIGVD